MTGKTAKYIISFIAFSLCILYTLSCKKAEEQNEIPLLIVTDFGRDVDDAQAFAYLAREIKKKRSGTGLPENISDKALSGKGKTPRIAGIICTGYIPQIRAKSLELFLNLYGLSVPIAIKEPEKSPEEVGAYFASHSINGTPYELTLLNKLGSFPPNNLMYEKMHEPSYYLKYLSPDKLTDSLLKAYPDELRLVILAQATQIARYMETHTLSRFHSIYIQGQCDTSFLSAKGIIKPDMAAYNLREDSTAAYRIFDLQKTTPFIFLSKYAAYPLAFTKDETDEAGKCGYAGEYLKNGAYMGLQCFLERDSATFYKIFALPPHIRAVKNNSPPEFAPAASFPALDSLKVVNNPYDLLTVMVIFRPELFEADTVYTGNIPHILIDGHKKGTAKENFRFY